MGYPEGDTMSAHPLDIRMAHLEGAYEQISDRLNGFDTRFATIESKIDDIRDTLLNEMNRRFERIDDRFERIDDRFERVDDQFAEMRKLIINGGFAIGAFVLISILLPIVQHFH
jgi:chaperonin cofactor prefoldin